MAGKRTEDYD